MQGNIRWPLAFNIIRRNSESNTFGMVRHYADGKPKPHQGWDFFAEPGTPCYAIGDGIVKFVGNLGDFGLIVVHSVTVNSVVYYAAYAHLSSADVKLKQKVAKGQMICKTGKSGNAENLPADDMHLHFEIRTTPLPGLGLAGRISPLRIYGICPLKVGIPVPMTVPAHHTSNRVAYA